MVAVCSLGCEALVLCFFERKGSLRLFSGFFFLSDYIRDLKKEFAGYDGAALGKDIMAGITVAAVALPLALAFGVGSGASAAAGMVTAVVGGLLIGALSGASYQISGPTGAMMAILLTLVVKEGMAGVLIAGFLSGLLLLIAGFLRLGRVIYFIPTSVITGFTSGIAAIIALGQLDNFFGVSSQGDLAIFKVLSYFQGGFSPDIRTMAMGLLVIGLMVVWPKKWNGLIPSSLAGLALALGVNTFLQWDIALVGDIPRTLILPDRLTLDGLMSASWGKSMMVALSIAALGMIESLLCGASAGKMKQERLNSDRELIAQGLGNMVIPFFGGIPATAAIARTSVAIKSGGVTRLTGLIHALILLLSMFVLTPVMSAIPLSALAGILLVTAWRMNDWQNIAYIFGHRFKSGIAKFLITMIATIFLDLTQAIIIGVVFSTLLILAKLTDVEINISDIDNSRLQKIGMGLEHVPDANEVRVVYLTGTIFFGVVDQMEHRLLSMPPCDAIILSMRGVPIIDVSGVQALTDFTQAMQRRGTSVAISSVQPKVMDYFKRGGFIDLIGEDHVYPSAENAIVRYVKDHY